MTITEFYVFTENTEMDVSTSDVTSKAAQLPEHEVYNESIQYEASISDLYLVMASHKYWERTETITLFVTNSVKPDIIV